MGIVTGAKRRLPLFVSLRMLKAAHEALHPAPETAALLLPPPPKPDGLLDEIDAIFDDIKATKRKKLQQKAVKPTQ
jgi:pyruvate-formate lyase-activating enzyme